MVSREHKETGEPLRDPGGTKVCLEVPRSPIVGALEETLEKLALTLLPFLSELMEYQVVSPVEWKSQVLFGSVL